MSYKLCCVPGCNITEGDGIPLHCFPNPVNEHDRFKEWIEKCAVKIEGKDDLYIFSNRRVCHRHFTSNYYYPKNRLCKLAIPMLNLSGMAQENMKSAPNTLNHKNTKPYVCEGSENYCRICAATTDKGFPIFDRGGDQDNLLFKINQYLPIKVSKDDGLPKIICHQCWTTIMAWDKFVKCSLEAEVLLQQRISVTQFLDPERKPKQEAILESAETTSGTEWKRRVSFESRLADRDSDGDVKYLTDGSTRASDDDDRPLATLAAKPRDPYQKFYAALVNFRNHFVTEHDSRECSDFSDSTDSESANELDSRVDLNSFDDLTESNMRKDKMDEQTRAELSQAQTKINGKVYYACKICGKHLSSTHTYVFHKRIHTGERPCVCHICGKQFRAPNGLQRHVTETHEKQRWYTCILCFNKFANSQNLKQHMRIHTGERPFVCAHCGKRFTQSGSLHVHLKTHSEHYPHHCAECGAKFRLRSGLTRHRLKHTGERPHVCAHCSKGFRQRHELNGHILTHTDSKPHACAVCGTAFRQRRALRHHCKRLHQSETKDVTRAGYNLGQYEGYPVLSCVKNENDTTVVAQENISKRTEVTPRTVTRDGKKYNTCDVCKKKVPVASWKRHSRSHQTVKRYSCHTCGLGFNDSGNLSRHRRALHAAHRPYKCHICNKSFSRNSHLEDHVKSHSDSRDYVCDVCGKASKSSAALRMHRKVHENELRFRCIYCEAKFRRKAQLQAHVSVHTGEKSHVCGCGKAFRLKGQLTIHARTHERVKQMCEDLYSSIATVV